MARGGPYRPSLHTAAFALEPPRPKRPGTGSRGEAGMRYRIGRPLPATFRDLPALA